MQPTFLAIFLDFQSTAFLMSAADSKWITGELVRAGGGLR
jgi:hypothetical protein